MIDALKKPNPVNPEPLRGRLPPEPPQQPWNSAPRMPIVVPDHPTPPIANRPVEPPVGPTKPTTVEIIKNFWMQGLISPEVIARNRDLLAQYLAAGKPPSAPGVYTPGAPPAPTPASLFKSGDGR